MDTAIRELNDLLVTMRNKRDALRREQTITHEVFDGKINLMDDNIGYVVVRIHELEQQEKQS